MRHVRVIVFDTKDVLLQACKEGDIEVSNMLENTVRFFLARLISKLLEKFPLEVVDIQFLLAKKVAFEVTLSEDHLEQYHKDDKEVLQKFSSFRLKVKDFRSYIRLEQSTSTKFGLLNYLEEDYADEEKSKLIRSFIGEKSDYYGGYSLELYIDEVDLA